MTTELTPKYGDKCNVMHDGQLCEAVVWHVDNHLMVFCVTYWHPETGREAQMTNIPFSKFRKITTT